MINITFNNLETVQAPEGITILEAARKAGLALDAPCAGRGTCGRCRVQASGGLDPPTPEETAELGEKGLSQGLRLACLARAASDASVELPHISKIPRRKATLSSEPTGGLYPNVLKVCIRRRQLTSNSSSDLSGNLRSLLASKGLRIEGAELAALRRLAEEHNEMTAVLIGESLVDVEPGDTSRQCYGVAIDLGTSTVAGYLVDLNGGRQLAAEAIANPQRAHGQDVISRIEYGSASELARDQLAGEAVAAMSDLVDRMAREADIDRDHIYEMTIAGNTAMLHLLLGIDAAGLARAPYRPVMTQALHMPASRLGIQINSQGMVYLLPAIAGFVGADTVAVILSTGMHRSRQLKLAIDLGTNGEIVLGSRDRLLCCSSAAGPAFEGGRIRCGMNGTGGAIERVIWENGPKVITIGGGKPRGICGSGLVDAVAGMLKQGIIDGSGRFAGEGLARDGFVLVAGGETQSGEPVVIAQRDIRELQLAKAAIRAGIEILKAEMGISDSDISEVLLAGAFGSYVDRESAAAIGLLPQILLDRVRSIGNAAGAGAKQALMSVKARREAERLARRVEHVELGSHRDFQEKFVDAMGFASG